MNPETPTISVVIPVHNGEPYLSAAIDSVLAQGDYRLDIVIIDDGSVDNTAEIANSYGRPVSYHYQTQSGAAVARNRGVELSSGDFIAFLDADDVWEPTKLTAQLQAFREQPQLDMIFGFAKQFVSPDVDDSLKRLLKCPEEAMPGYLPSAMLVKRSSFLAAGFFSSEHQVGEFVDWYAKATEAGLSSLMLPQVVMRRRIHENNQGVNKRDSYHSAFLRILKQKVDRRRRGDKNGG